MQPPFRILEHPSDLGIEAMGPTLPRAFENAAAGMMSVILDISSVQARGSRTIELGGTDYGQLLVRWLSEILYLYDGQQFVGKEFGIVELTPTALRGTVRGEDLNSARHTPRLDVKAVTYHQLAVEQDEAGARVRVFLDI